MATDISTIFLILAMGISATLVMDVWQRALFLTLKIPVPDWSALGRWFLGMPDLGLVQPSLARLPNRPYEKFVGWAAHYFVGIGYAAMYFYLVKIFPISALNLALVFAALSLLVPWCLVMPCTGHGFFASNTPKPRLVRIYNVATHLVFSFSLYMALSLLTKQG